MSDDTDNSSKWILSAAIATALITAISTIYSNSVNNTNLHKLEILKIEAEELKYQREHLQKRCDSMNSLLVKLNTDMQTVFDGDAVKKLKQLRIYTNIASSYLGEKALEEYAHFLKNEEEKAEKSGVKPPIEYKSVGAIRALSVELEGCNKPKYSQKV